MTYVVTENCIACKYTDCVEVCPVDCFYEGENTLVIHPDECIDCGVCEPECPADAIRPDTEPDMEKWVEFNRKYSEMWPVIVSKKDPMPNAEEMDGKPGGVVNCSHRAVARCFAVNSVWERWYRRWTRRPTGNGGTTATASGAYGRWETGVHPRANRLGRRSPG